MSTLAIGVALGFIVSIPPGPNSLLCVSLASGGIRRAVPLITGAALTDAAYSLLAASGLLIASKAGVRALEYLGPGFILATAALTWFSAVVPPRVVAAVPVLNPTTAAIWLGLSSVPAAQTLSLPEALLRPLPVAIGTATWFALLAAASARTGMKLGPGQTLLFQRSLACLLGIGGVTALAIVLA